MIPYETLLKKTRAYASLCFDKGADRVSHCYMFVTDDEYACEGLCRLAVRALLCPDGGCGSCLDCKRSEDGVHVAQKDVADKVVNAETADEIIDATYLKSGKGNLKVIVIYHADGMTPQAQNKLLKTLEEPQEGVVFILGVTHAAAVLDTVKSRSKKLYCGRFDIDELAEELKRDEFEASRVKTAAELANGNLTRAVKIVKDEDFIETYAVWLNILEDMTSSRDVAEMTGRLKNDAASWGKYLDVLEVLVNGMTKSLRDGAGRGIDAHLSALARSRYNMRSLINIEYLINDCRKRLASNCAAGAVGERLLMGMLEVRHLCQ